MDENLGSQIIKAALALDEGFGKIDDAISKIPDDEERKIYAQKLGTIIGQVNDSIIRPIVKQHPKLDPDAV